MYKYLVLLFLIPSIAFGVELKYITKDAPAPFAGFLITPETEVYFRQLKEDNEQQKRTIANYKEIVTMHELQQALAEKRIMAMQEQNNSLIEQQVKMDGTFSKITMFLLGATATIFITYGVSQARN